MNRIEMTGTLWKGLNDSETFIDNIDSNTFDKAYSKYKALEIQYHQFSKTRSNFADLLDLLGVNTEIGNNKKYKITIEEVND